MSILIKGMTAKELLDVFQWARTGANNCMIGHGVVATELPDHGDLIDRDELLKIKPWDWEECDPYEVECAKVTIKAQPVIIPAEGSEDAAD